MHNKIWLILALLMGSHCTYALQIKSVADDRKVIVTVAKDALNRIAVVEDRIAQVFGLEDDFFMETDEKSGQIFIRPKEKKIINLSIITEKHVTIDLQLLVNSKEAETILLKPKPAAVLAETRLVSTDHANKISKLILAMAKNQNITGFSVGNTNKEIILWENIKIVQTNEYIGKGLIGEVYSVTNNTKQSICMTETQFGLEKDIAGVALRKHILAPAECTTLYIVRHIV